MAAYTNPHEVQKASDGVLKVWAVNPEFKLKDLTKEKFQADFDAFMKVLNDLKAKDDEMVPLRNQRDDLAVKLNGYCTRVRAGIKGYFGANSSEYEQAGGTRSSQIKRSGPKGKNTPAPKP